MSKKSSKKYVEKHLVEAGKFIRENNICTMVDLGNDKKIDISPYIAVAIEAVGTDSIFLDRLLVHELEADLGMEELIREDKLGKIKRDIDKLMLPVSLNLDNFREKRLIYYLACNSGKRSLGAIIVLLNTIIHKLDIAYERYAGIESVRLAIIVTVWWLKYINVTFLDMMDKELKNEISDDLIESIDKYMGEEKELWIKMVSNDISAKDLLRKLNEGIEVSDYYHLTKEMIIATNKLLEENGGVRYEDNLGEIYKILFKRREPTGKLTKKLRSYISSQLFDSVYIYTKEVRNKELEGMVGALNSDLERMKNSKSKVSKLLKEEKKVNKEYLEEIGRLNNELNKITTGNDGKKLLDIIESYKKKVKKLEGGIEILKKENEALLKANSSLRKEIKGNKIRKVYTKLPNTIELEDSQEEVSDKDIEEMVETLNNYKIAIVGGHQRVVEWVRNVGWNNVNIYTAEVSAMELSGVSSCDLVIAIVSYTCHPHILKVKRHCKRRGIQIVYFGGTNINNLVSKAYKEIKNMEVEHAIN